MINIAIQPCGDSDAIGHYQDTIMNPVSISRILPFLSATQQDYIKSLEINQVAIWGVTPVSYTHLTLPTKRRV